MFRVYVSVHNGLASIIYICVHILASVPGLPHCACFNCAWVENIVYYTPHLQTQHYIYSKHSSVLLSVSKNIIFMQCMHACVLKNKQQQELEL